MQTVHIPYEIQKVESMANGTIKIIAYSDNLKSETKTTLFDLQKKQWRAVIGESEHLEIDKDKLAEAMTSPVREGKSPSKRLRDVLYRLWEQEEHQWKDPFELCYQREMEKIIDDYKRRLG